MNEPYQTQDEIKSVVEGFESCRTGKEDFRHRDHLTVAVWYLWNSTQEQALDRMRVSLKRFITHHGVDNQKYKEDLTVAWISAVHNFLIKLEPNASVVDATNMVHKRFADKDAIEAVNGRPIK